jgi:hypothetical protein
VSALAGMTSMREFNVRPVFLPGAETARWRYLPGGSEGVWWFSISDTTLAGAANGCVACVVLLS